jgi:hypothetical protein
MLNSAHHRRGAEPSPADTSMRWVSGDDDSGGAWERVRFQAFINSGGVSDYDGNGSLQS